ncbi:MAG: hypothetical protein ABI241_00585 [Bacteroidia bacterium]
MARLLRDKDYFRLIQSDNLLQIIESNQSVKLDIEHSAQAEITSYLTQRYDVSLIFTDTTKYNNTAVYKGNNLVEYTQPEIDLSKAYIVNDLVSFDGKIYKCLVNCVGVPTNIDDNWEYVQDDLMLYYLKLPVDAFNPKLIYPIGSAAWYKDSVYTSIKDSTAIYPTNTGFWSAGVPYSVNNVPPTDVTKWIQGDNRNQQIILYLIDITLYHLHSRINPRNIPDLRKERYDGNSHVQAGGAVGWLKRVASGDVTADLPSIAPTQGLSIRWGSYEQNDNTF